MVGLGEVNAALVERVMVRKQPIDAVAQQPLFFAQIKVHWSCSLATALLLPPERREAPAVRGVAMTAKRVIARSAPTKQISPPSRAPKRLWRRCSFGSRWC